MGVNDEVCGQMQRVAAQSACLEEPNGQRRDGRDGNGQDEAMQKNDAHVKAWGEEEQIYGLEPEELGTGSQPLMAMLRGKHAGLSW
jgi:hypothetical protein